MSFLRRIVEATKLNPGLYEEVEADKSALKQAMTVIVLSSVAAGIGASQYDIPQLAMAVLVSLLSWIVWAYICYFVGARLLPEPQTRADHGELLRTLGFAASPGLLRVFGVIPGVAGGVIFAVATVWMFIATVIAVRQALDYTSTGRALAVVLIGFLVQAVLVLAYVMLFPRTIAAMLG